MCQAQWVPTNSSESQFYLVPPGLQMQQAEVQGKCLLHASSEVMRSAVSHFWNTVVAAENSQKALSMCTIIRKQGERASINEREGK